MRAPGWAPRSPPAPRRLRAPTSTTTSSPPLQRVVTSPGSQINVGNISQIQIYSANASGNPIGSLINTWAPGTGPTVDGVALKFHNTSVGWSACPTGNRNNGANPDSIGVSLTYQYDFVTPLGNFVGGVRDRPPDHDRQDGHGPQPELRDARDRRHHDHRAAGRRVPEPPGRAPRGPLRRHAAGRAARSSSCWPMSIIVLCGMVALVIDVVLVLELVAPRPARRRRRRARRRRLAAGQSDDGLHGRPRRGHQERLHERHAAARSSRRSRTRSNDRPPRTSRSRPRSRPSSCASSGSPRSRPRADSKAEFVLPVPMGSPQNYYGVGFYEGLTGGATQTYGPSLPTSSLTSGSFAQFTNRTNGYTSNNQYATGTVGQGTAGQTQAYGTFGLSVPGTNTSAASRSTSRPSRPTPPAARWPSSCPRTTAPPGPRRTR